MVLEIVIIPIILFYGFFFIFLLWILKKDRALFKISKDVYALKFVDSKDGLITLKSGHTWDISRSKPKTLKWFLGSQPFYVLDYNSTVPLELDKADTKPELITPKMLNNLIKIETLGKFLSISGLNKKEMLMWILIGAGLGFFFAISLIATGIVPLGATAPVVPAIPTEPVPIVGLFL